MRVLSPHSGFSLQVIEAREVIEHDRVTGQAYTRTDQKPYIADFEESATGGGLFPHEREIALRVFAGSFKGLPEGTNPLTRIGVWDSEAAQVQENWPDEYRIAIEKRVKFLADQRPSRCIVVDMPRAAKPWPKYDEAENEEVLAYIDVLGIDPAVVIFYEQDQDVPNLELIELLKDKQAEGAASTEVVATVSG